MCVGTHLFRCSYTRNSDRPIATSNPILAIAIETVKAVVFVDNAIEKIPSIAYRLCY